MAVVVNARRNKKKKAQRKMWEGDLDARGTAMVQPAGNVAPGLLEAPAINGWDNLSLVAWL
jgi:hypothetical protein